MSITYQSIQTNTASSGTTVVVTKPTSLAVGDLMIASAAGNTNTSVTLPTGFTVVHSGKVDTLREYATGYKVATAGDVAASNFTFTYGGTIGGATASLLRFTTSTSFPATPVISSTSSLYSGGTNSAPVFTIGLPSGPSTTFFVANYFANANITSSTQASSPSRTWTERNDYNASGLSSSIATAPNSAIDTIATFSMATSGATTSHTISFLIIAEQKTETGNIDFQAITPTQFGITAAVNVNPDIAHQNIPVTQFGITGKASSDGTQWTNPDKIDTDWTNPNK